LLVGEDNFFFFLVPHPFSQDIGEWPQNQIILIPDWTYFHCPGATLMLSWYKSLFLQPYPFENSLNLLDSKGVSAPMMMLGFGGVVND